MKKYIVHATSIFSLLFIISANLFILFTPLKANAMDPIVCKVEIFDCPGLGTGDRQICHENGNGVTCNCGDSTNCPIKE